MQGDFYEYMLDKLATAGQNGQFHTPKHIREMMVQRVKPTPEDTICDPACGTAGFLVSASEYIRKNFEATMTSEQWEYFDKGAFSGFDTDSAMLRISAMNLMLHSINNTDIDYKDSVSTAVLVFTKTNDGGTEKVWFYDMRADGKSLDDKRQETDKNDSISWKLYKY